jgi:hypothetical protein
VVIRDDATRLEILLEEVTPADLPGSGDRRLSIGVNSKAFSGRNDRVWVQREVWERFVADLTALERRRRGSAQLVAMSPTDLSLSISTVDSAGHIAIHGYVGDDARTGAGTWTHSQVGFGIEIDPTALPALLEGVATLGGPAKDLGFA